MHFYLVTTYNHQPFVEQAIASIWRQYASPADFNQRARVLIVDDASLDNTQGELERLATQYPNLRVRFNASHQGSGKTRNQLLDWLYTQIVVADDHVIFLDGGHMLARHHLRHKLSLFARDPELDVVGGQLQFFYMDGRPDHIVDTFSLDPEIQEIAHLFECHFYASNAMFRGDVFKRPHMRFPETQTADDWLFFALQPLRKRHAEEVTLMCRQHTSGDSKSTEALSSNRQLRHTAHRLWALRIGVHLSHEECELLDLVGYLSFQLRIGAQASTNVNAKMPGALEIKEQSYALTHWADARKALHTLFQKLLDNNARISCYSPPKLKSFLEGILKLADQEAMAATIIEVGRAPDGWSASPAEPVIHKICG